jgi:hypothetical protein
LGANDLKSQEDDREAPRSTPLDVLTEGVNRGDHDQHLAWVLRDIEQLRDRPKERRPETLTSIDAALRAIRARLRAVEPRP